MNREYQKANEKAMMLMIQVDGLIVKKLENSTQCVDREIKDHRIKMIEYMEREVDRLSHSVDSYLEAETTAK